MNDTANAEVAAQNQAASNPTMTITSGVDMAAVNSGTGLSEHEQDVQTIAKVISAVPADDTTPEEELLTALKGYRLAAKTRFAHILTGMANSTAEALRFLGEAEVHLADHITQMSATHR